MEFQKMMLVTFLAIIGMKNDAILQLKIGNN